MQPPSEANGPRLISDEDIQRFRLDKVTPHNAPITLADYDRGWPVLFAREAARIRAALGARAVQVEHVGSTSVPGLAAKPIIDILLAVPDSSDEQTYVPALEAAGYVRRAREPGWFEHRMFKGPDTDINLHVFTAGAAEIDQMLLFRDWLRNNDADRDAYLQAKRDLAQRTWRHDSTMPTPRPRSWNRSSLMRPCTGVGRTRASWPCARPTRRWGGSTGRMTDLAAHHAIADLTAEPHLVEISEPKAT